MRTPTVKLPEEDPATKAAREREQARAESARTEETQALLLGDTVRRLRRFGRVGGSGGSVPIYGGRPSTGGVRSGSGGSGIGGGTGPSGFATAIGGRGNDTSGVQIY